MYGDGMDTNGDGKVDQNDDPYSPYYPGKPPTGLICCYCLISPTPMTLALLPSWHLKQYNNPQPACYQGKAPSARSLSTFVRSL